jgi:hypothetical protein
MTFATPHLLRGLLASSTLVLSSLPGIAKEVVLAEDGKAGLPIVIPGNAGPLTRTVAEDLATQLERISGAPFTITTNPVAPAIVLSRTGGNDTPAFERENYVIRTTESGLQIKGTTEFALQHGAWDLLHRLGYRQFFPGSAWEVVPSIDRLAIELDVEESPDYHSRRIWYGFGFWDHNREPWADWVKKNRMEGGFKLNTGHAYGRLIRSQQEIFDAHPEYYALVDGKRHVVPHAKLCISNPGVRKAAVDYALEFLEQNLVRMS